MKKLVSLMIGAFALTLSGAGAATLDDVRAKGFMQCGIATGFPGFAYTDSNGDWQGFDPAFCRAMAAAIFGDSTAVKFTPTTGKTRFTALASGEVDVLARNTTETFSRDVDLKFTFAGPNYYDGQGFLVRKSLGVNSALNLSGATVCIQTGTTTELNLADFFRANNMQYEPVPVETDSEAQEKYLANACDAYTTDASGLAATKSAFADPQNHIILPEIISKEPLAPLVRHGDDQWADIMKWVRNVLVIAEEKGITQANVDSMKSNPPDPEVARMLGVEGEYGAMLGLGANWARDAIKAGGNYGEIFARHIGKDTPVGLDRGLNALYTDGGVMYAAPLR